MGGCFVRQVKSPTHPQPLGTNLFVQNSYIDRWSEPQIRLLRDKFNEYKTDHGLLRRGFLQLFPGLAALPPSVIDNTYKFFDSSTAQSVTFREFCVAMAQIIMGSREEKCRFFFKVFDSDADQTLNDTELRVFMQFAGDAIVAEQEGVARYLRGPAAFEVFHKWCLDCLDFNTALRVFEVVPTLWQEKEIISNFQVGVGVLRPGDIRYLLSKAWWDVWCLYVFYGEEVKPGQEDLHRKRRSGTVFYGDRPAAIDNTGLFMPRSRFELRQGLVESVDYVVLHQQSWLDFVSWYGGGPPIKRWAYYDTATPDEANHRLELYPPVLSVYLTSSNGKPAKDSLRRFQLSAYMTFEESLVFLKEELGLDRVLQHRLWLLKDRWELVEPHAQLMKGGVTTGSELLIESQVITPRSAYWPRDRKDNFLNDRPIRIGEIVDVKKAQDWVTAEVVSLSRNEVTVKLEDGVLETFDRNSDDIQSIPAGGKLAQIAGSGAVGLLNLGNTCYMNSIVQCISNTPLLKDFLLNETYIQHINTANAAGSKGKVSFDFGRIVKELWTSKARAVSSSKFYKTFTDMFVQFKGHEQHDCHEFLGSLLEVLHEDLVRSTEASQPLSSKVIEQPSREQEVEAANQQWKEIQGNQASVISSLFGGQTSTKISCRGCGYAKVLFDIFMNLPLPIPVSTEMLLEVTYVPRFSALLKCSFLLAKSSTFMEVVTALSEVTGLDCKKLLLAEVISDRVITTYDAKLWTRPIRAYFPRQKISLHAFEVFMSVREAEQDGKRTLPFSRETEWGEFQVGDQIDAQDSRSVWSSARVIEIAGTDLIIRYDDAEVKVDEKIPRTSERLSPFRKFSKPKWDEILSIRMLNGARDPVTKRFTPIGSPQVVSIGSWYSLRDLHEIVFKMQRRFISGQVGSSAPYSLHVTDQYGASCGLCRRCEGCPLPVEDTNIDQVFKFPGSIGLIAVWPRELFTESIESHQSLETNREKEEALSRPLELTSCFNEFTQEEQVDWECEKCKTKGNVSLQQQIWRVPDILILVLKRFAFQAGFLEKITQTVAFPLFSLDTSTWVRSAEPGTGFTLSTTAFQRAYDLYAVVNHTGTLSGGHYTTYCLSQETEDRSRWLLYDDDHVYEVQGEPEHAVVSRDAYMLCYRRRHFTSSNLVNLSY
jgi:ubiquitin carboxyl-terminal hydrolase 4/11/15